MSGGGVERVSDGSDAHGERKMRKEKHGNWIINSDQTGSID